MKRKFIILAAVVGLVSISWGGYQALQWQRMEEMAAFLQENERAELQNLKQLMGQWDDTVRLAEFAPRDQLLGLISRLQEIKRSVEPMFFVCQPMGGTGPIRLGMGMAIGVFLHHMQQSSGNFDHSMLDHSNERIKTGTNNLNTNCGY